VDAGPLDGGIIAEHYIAASLVFCRSFPACSLQDIALAEFTHIGHANEGVNGIACDNLHIAATDFIAETSVEFSNHFLLNLIVAIRRARFESGIISADSGKVEVELANGKHG